jgi:hypothetical protein
MMNLVMFGYFVSTQYFSDMTDINLKELMFERKMQEIHDDVPPFGHIDDGVDQAELEEKQKEWNGSWHTYSDYKIGVEDW